jgi:hypothetical protein
MAYLLWQRGDTTGAVVAALFPFLITAVATFVIFFPPLAIGLVQARFLSAIGLQPSESDTLSNGK